jgi:hypothetical protein
VTTPLEDRLDEIIFVAIACQDYLLFAFSCTEYGSTVQNDKAGPGFRGLLGVGHFENARPAGSNGSIPTPVSLSSAITVAIVMTTENLS